MVVRLALLIGAIHEMERAIALTAVVAVADRGAIANGRARNTRRIYHTKQGLLLTG
jgi:hypothetical protein